MSLTDYEPVEQLGSGAFGTVYRARHRFLHRQDAVKVLDRIEMSTMSLRQFEGECVAMARVDHPNVAKIYTAGIHNGRTPWLAMEYCPRGSVADAVPMGWPEACVAISQAAAGVAAIHSAGILHRDLKAQNLLLGDGGRVKVSDLGLAQFASGLTLGPATTTVALAGTFAFMAPELFEGAKPGTGTDVYALGATLFQLLAGTPPFVDTSTTLPELIGRILHETVDVSALAVPDAARDLIAQSLHKDPACRPVGAGELVDALAALSPDDAGPLRLFDLPEPRPGLTTAEKRLRRAALLGDQAAMMRLSDLLRRSGREGEADDWMLQAAGAGHPGAMYQLGVQHRHRGESLEADRWLRRAADAGHLLAVAELDS